MSNKPHESSPESDTIKCGAQSRNGTPCKNSAMKNGRCRLHGGLSTGPKTMEGLAKCGNWKHGRYSKREKERQELIQKLSHLIKF